MNSARENGCQGARNEAGSARIARLASAAALLGLFSGFAMAADGHHAVDDATILDQGQCKIEGWLTGGGGERLLHAGAACRVGPLDLAAAAEYARPGGGSETGWSLQAKWATELTSGFSVGLLVTPAWHAHVRPRSQGTTVSGLGTWARDELALHLNVGRDFVHGAADESRYGLAAEWAPLAAWSFVAERYRAGQAHFVRAGARWALGAGWSVDLSRARRLAGPGPSNWTFGATREFGR